MLAATFVHNKFPHRAPDDRAILRCFPGRQPAASECSRSRRSDPHHRSPELDQILGSKPNRSSPASYKWKGAMAQYGVGHLTASSESNPLAPNNSRASPCRQRRTAESACRDCVRTGTAAVEEMLKRVGSSQFRI